MYHRHIILQYNLYCLILILFIKHFLDAGELKIKATEDLRKPELEKLLNISTETAKLLEEKHKPKNISFEEAREAAWNKIELQKRHFGKNSGSMKRFLIKNINSQNFNLWTI